MKKKTILLAALAAVVMSALAACAGAPMPTTRTPAPAGVPTSSMAPVSVEIPAPTGNLFAELDSAIQGASAHINERVPNGSVIAVINIESEHPALSEYIITALMANLVNDGYFTVVDRHQLDAIRDELHFHMSGEVDDNTAQAIGRMVGAQTIILGSFTEIASMHLLSVRALAVETAVVQGLFNQTISGAALVRAFTGGAPGIGAGTRGGLFANGEFQGEMDLFDAVSWISRNAVDRGEYVIVVGRNETVRPLSLAAGNRHITVTLQSDGHERSITYDTPSRPSASLFTVGTGVTLNLEEGITLVGLPADSRPMVRIQGGNFVMNGGSIRDNHMTGIVTGVFFSRAWDEGEFAGGAVLIERGTFVMNSGTIKGNFAHSGGGVYIEQNGNFIMRGGIISGNVAAAQGGGVAIRRGSFTMHGGSIDNNSAIRGGGVHAFFSSPGEASLFIMRGGVISGNSASVLGGGVFLGERARFEISGGVIYGIDATAGLANRSTFTTRFIDERDIVHALFSMYSFDYRYAFIRNNTIGEGVTMNNVQRHGWNVVATRYLPLL